MKKFFIIKPTRMIINILIVYIINIMQFMNLKFKYDSLYYH